MRLVCVVVGADSSKNRFKDASMLLNYGFANYENKKLLSKDEMVVSNLRIDGAKQKVVAGYSECDVFALCKKGSQDEYQIQHSINKIKAPLAKNSVVGKIFVIKDGNVEQEINMIVHCNVEERTIFDNIKFITSKM